MPTGTNPYYTESQVNQYPPVSNPYNVNSQPNNYFPNANGQMQPPNPPQYYQQPLYPPYRNDMANRPISPRDMSPNVLIVQMHNPRPGPNLTQCQYCRIPTGTYAQLRSGAFVWLMCFVIMLLTCCCWWIAFWIDDWKDTVFRCTRCNNIKAVKEGGC